MCIGAASAVVRATNSAQRATTTRTTTRDVTPRTNESYSGRGTASRTTSNAARTVTPRATTKSTTSRTATTSTASRATTRRLASIAPNTTTTFTRAATVSPGRTGATRATSAKVSRAATTSKTFGAGYNSCRDAYFTCMDQFCASSDDSYRRCVCSARLDEIKNKQRALSDAADNIQDFRDLNIAIIPKTAGEVNAMLNATAGETVMAKTKDNSDAAKQLTNIGNLLQDAKNKSLSTAGQRDIAGDIKSIWATTNLASGVNIANLSGEALYTAVHSQCADLVAEHCESRSTLNMVVAAYGMYIENDCSLLSGALDKKKDNTNATIRETEREMNSARLDNYNAHNSTSINDCVAKVRRDITADNACGTDYIHCLDVSGLYLNKATGEPIYTADFYQLETMVSLSGDILTNQTNRMLVAELNRKREFAEKSLSTCQDLSEEVWDEFKRQAITEIYQGQQSRIRRVKDECLDVVNKCYDQQTASLRDFSNTKEQLLLGSQLELSEQLCQEKLAACSNLYGGGDAGMQELIDTMYNITSQKIAQNCLTTLQEYVTSICAVPPSDTTHTYPYACRVYVPGEQQYAKLWKCQNQFENKNKNSGISSSTTSGSSGTGNTGSSSGGTSIADAYYCPVYRRYTSCKPGYYLSDCIGNTSISIANPAAGNSCKLCPTGASKCSGGNYCPVYQQPQDDTTNTIPSECGDYVGSLYQKVVTYAIQACMRPTTATGDQTPISSSVLQDVNTTMDSVRTAMSTSLQTECERLGGYWVATQYSDSAEESPAGNTIRLYARFYEETGANKKWGYCADPIAAGDYYGNTSSSTTSENQSDDDES